MDHLTGTPSHHTFSPIPRPIPCSTPIYIPGATLRFATPLLVAFFLGTTCHGRTALRLARRAPWQDPLTYHPPLATQLPTWLQRHQDFCPGALPSVSLLAAPDYTPLPHLVLRTSSPLALLLSTLRHCFPVYYLPYSQHLDGATRSVTA